VAFETVAVYDPSVAADIPVFHYFFCDECNPGNYRDETLIKGYRYVARDSLDADLCESCQSELQLTAIRAPNQRWIDRQKQVHGDMLQTFKEIDKKAQDSAAAEKAKNEYRKQLLISRRADTLQ